MRFFIGAVDEGPVLRKIKLPHLLTLLQGLQSYKPLLEVTKRFRNRLARLENSLYIL